MIKRINSLIWIFEPLLEDPTYAQRKMFGCEVAYLHGRQTLVLADQGEPWNGLLVCTAREHHESLRKQFPELTPHEVLGKWLYISQANPRFESVVTDLAERARKGDERLGIEPRGKKKAGKKARKPRK